jgi:MFS family permease
MLYLLALFYQDGLGLSALQSGLSTVPEALGVMLGGQVTTRLVYPVLGPRRPMGAGLVLAAIAMASLSLVSSVDELWWARLALFVTGFGMSGLFIPSQAAAFATIARDQMGRASTLFNAERQLGGAAGVALLTSVLAIVDPLRHVGPHLVANLPAYHDAFLVASVSALLGAVAALRVEDHEAAATITRWREVADLAG